MRVSVLSLIGQTISTHYGHFHLHADKVRNPHKFREESACASTQSTTDWDYSVFASDLVGISWASIALFSDEWSSAAGGMVLITNIFE